MASRDEDPAAVEPRRLQVMTVTEGLIAERGFDGLRLRDVATGAGVSIGLIQHYFGTRETLMLDTLRHTSRARAEEWTALASGVDEPVERTRVLLRGAIADRQRCRAWMEASTSATRHPELLPMITETYSAWQHSLRGALQEGIDHGAFRPVVPLDQVLDTIMAMIDGLMVAVGLEVYAFDRTYHALLIQDIAGRLLQHDFTPLGEAAG